jgi:hypothetical protein
LREQPDVSDDPSVKTGDSADDFDCNVDDDPLAFTDQERAILDSIHIFFRMGFDYDDAGLQVKRMQPDPSFHAVVDCVVLKAKALARDIRHETIFGGRIPVEDQGGGWYGGVSRHDVFWPSLQSYLESQDRWRNAVPSLDRSSRFVTSLLANPNATESQVKGLVVGYVQSGKTANFTATIAKAADQGYRLFIVLSGIHNALRRQTQVRMDEHLESLNSHRWQFLTDESSDFGDHLQVGALMAEDLRVLGVVKKNKMRLLRLQAWLETAADRGYLERCPVLIIDDEADQATVNAARNARDDVTAIHDLVKKIVAIPRRCTYVGYTATPFANVLMNARPDDTLYPRDFMYALPKPDGYFGAADIFAPDLAAPETDSPTYDIVRFIDSAEVDSVVTRGSEVDPSEIGSLITAVRWFALASAARRARGHEDHSSMLVHTSALVEEHKKLSRFLEEHVLPLLRSSAQELDHPEHSLWRETWEAESSREPSDRHGLDRLTFEEVWTHVAEVLDDWKVVVDNSFSTERLVYADEKIPVIVVGGNTLSRGLTLEGLVCSYFVRSAKTYDALLQMGRWFGYRPGYGDLVRLWTSADLWENFRFLSVVEEDLRSEIRRYFSEGLRPGQVAPRIRTHPSLSVTGQNKLQFAVESFASFGGRHPQTTYFSHRDKEIVGRNQSAAADLVEAALVSSAPSSRGPHTILTDVPWAAVKRFIISYSIHESSSMTRKALIDYVEQQRDLGRLGSWNLAIMSKRGTEGDARLDLGLAGPVPCITRTKLIGSSTGTTANIGTLMSRPDRVVDLTGDASTLSDAQMQALRDEDGRPLIALYPIAKDSPVAAARQRYRSDLDAVDHLVAVGFSFPNDHPDTPFGGSVITLAEEYLEEIRGELSKALEEDGEGDYKPEGPRG